MDNWDSLFPFTADEINLFSRLHQKATKFPAPAGIKERSVQCENSNSNRIEDSSTYSCGSTDSTEEHIMKQIKNHLFQLKTKFEESKRLLNDFDLILKVHKQLELIEQMPREEVAAVVEKPSKQSFSLISQLEQVQLKISYIEKVNCAHYFLCTVSIPSAVSSSFFTDSLRLLLQHENGQLLTPQLLQRICYFERKCWDNAILAMERVLERDMVSIEAYLDDAVYKEMRDKILKELITPLLINPQIFHELIIHFITTYCQLRENFVTFVLDARLNTQFSGSPPIEQVLHFIERTRLLMVVERREFLEVFGRLPKTDVLALKSNLNKILETVGNLLFQRIEIPCKQLTNQDSEEISSFIHPLMESILIESDQNDPFGLFLKLLTQKFNFTKKPSVLKIASQANSDIHNDPTSTNVINV